MKRLFQTFSIISLTIMIVAGWAMFAHHRSILVGSVTAVAEAASLTTGRMALHAISARLTDYIEAANRAGDEAKVPPLPTVLQQAIAELARDSRIVRVKIYRRNGMVIFSTRQEQVGGHQEANPGFATAMAGKVSVQLIYRDAFNAFDGHTEEDNLVQTYFPVQGSPGSPVVGVFEIYTDANALVVATERSELTMLAGTVVAIACIYLALLLLAHRASRIIEAQQSDIREKNVLLERLSQRSMRREEGERRELASELHEGLAQSLSAVKVALENLADVPAEQRSEMLNAVIPSLRSAIGHARSIAEHLHPPSLEEFGLGPTVRELLREFAAAHPSVRLEHQVSIDEAVVPEALKIAIYRIVEAALRIMDSDPEVNQASIALRTSGRELVLAFEHSPAVMAAAMQGEDGAVDPDNRFGELRERVMISKGTLLTTSGADGAAVMRATWRF